ncbi:MAG: mono/diheme cytochrome c family protein [Candidatus Azotimanducaceae bacterium]|jgi:mono/diheme cytochrome c family protein
MASPCGENKLGEPRYLDYPAKITMISRQKLTKLIAIFVSAVCFFILNNHALADNRLLHFKTSTNAGTETVQSLNLKEMHNSFTEIERQLFDIQYKAHRRYKGFDLREVLAFAGFEPGATLMLVCEDGYKITLDTSVLDDSDLQGMIATSDLAPTQSENWELYSHGRELVSFDPFYVVWSKQSDSGPAPSQETLSVLKKLPWPYQFQEIRDLQESDYIAAKPSSEASTEIHEGFSQYMDNCYKCHQVSGVGGTLAPALDRAGSIASTLPLEPLSKMIRNIKDYYPLTKMPNYTNTLTEKEALEVAAYLKYAIGAN